MLQDRVDRAVELFKEGYNCSQALCGAFGDMYGFTFEESVRMGASFGGGIGRMRQTCGAACGLFVVVGLKFGSIDPKDAEAKAKNYQVVQELADKFKEINGSLICAELLGLAKNSDYKDTTPEARTKEYYKKRPCSEMVRSAAQIWVDYIGK